ncbi:uncharacterized protein [Oscarella lobularis]
MSSKAGNVEIMKYLVAARCRVRAVDYFGYNALHLALRGGKREAVQYLLSDVFQVKDLPKEWVCTVFHCACQGGLFEVAKTFVKEHGSQILEQRDEFGMTSYLNCVTSGNWELIGWMKSRGCNVAVRNGWGDTALHLCLMCGDENAFLRLFESIAKEIGKTISKGKVSCAEKCLEIRNDDGETLFLLACKKGLLKAVNFLLELNCRWQAKNKWGASGLHVSCEMGHVPVVEVLLNKCEFDLDKTDDKDETALMKGARSGNLTVVQMLMKKKEQWDLGHRNAENESIFTLACNGREPDDDQVAHYFLNCGDANFDGDGMLMAACRSGLLSIVEHLFERGYSLNQRNEAKQSLVHLACEYRQLEVAHFLVEHKVDLDVVDAEGYTALAYACESGLFSIVKCLVQKGCSLTVKTKHWGQGLLHLCCGESGNLSVAEFLVERGVEIHSTDNDGKTPIMLACQRGNLAIVEYLHRHGSFSLTVRTKQETALFHLSIGSKYCPWGSPNVSNYLIGIVSNDYLSKSDSRGNTPLMLACESGLLSTVKCLVARGCSLTTNGESLLRIACENGHEHVAEYLLNLNIDWYQLDEITSLQKSAFMGGTVNVLRTLLEHRLSHTGSKDQAWLSLLPYFFNSEEAAIVLMNRGVVEMSEEELFSMACEKDAVRVFDRLVERGFDFTQQNKVDLRHLSENFCVGHVLLDYCFKYDKSSDAQLKESLLKFACDKGILGIVTRLLELGFSLEFKTKDGKNLLHLACNSDHEGVAHYLLDCGIAVNEIDENGESALMMACRRNHLSVVKRLVANGCSLSQRTRLGESLLHLSGGVKVTRYLLANGANVNDRDVRGNTLLMAACFQKDGKALRLLLKQQNCLVNAKNENQQTALHNACKRRTHYDINETMSIIKDLLDSGVDVTVFDKFGVEALSYFLENLDYVTNHSCLETLKRLVLAGASVTAVSVESKESVLHVIAKYSRFEEPPRLLRLTEYYDFFIEKGANPDWRDNDGKLPYEYAAGEMRKTLRDAWNKCQYSKLLELGITKPSKLKVCLIGKGGAGKTTLMKSLRRKQAEGRLSFESEIRVDDSTDPSLRTAGVDVVRAIVDGAGEVVFCDFAGQSNFHKTHSLFLSESNTLYLLVVDLTESEQEIRFRSSYWLSLTKCSVGSSSKNNVIIIGSRGDKTDGRGVMKRLLNSLKAKFGKYFIFSDETFVLDCRVSVSETMQRLREYIGHVKEECIERATGVPKIVDEIQSSFLHELREIVEASDPLVSLANANRLPHFIRFRKVEEDEEDEEEEESFSIRVEDDEILDELDLSKETIKAMSCRHFLRTGFFCLLIDWNIFRGLPKDTLNRIVQFLDGIGEIIAIDKYVILNPSWLCHNVIGPLMSPNDFPIYMEEIDDGSVSLERVNEALRQFNKNKHMSIDEVMEILCALEVCYRVPDKENAFRFPALIEERLRNAMWKHKEDMTVYVGRRLQCRDDTDIIVPGTIPFLQTRSVVSLDPCPMIWKDGMVLEKLVTNFKIEGLIELHEGGDQIDIVARGPVLSEKECLEFLEEMVSMTMKVLDERSPGTILGGDLYLSASSLQDLVKHPLAYDRAAIDRAAGGSVTTRRGRSKCTDTLRKLLLIPSDHYCMLSRNVKVSIEACFSRVDFSRVGVELGRKLGMPMADVMICKDCPGRFLARWSEGLDAKIPLFASCARELGLRDILAVLRDDVPSIEVLECQEDPVSRSGDDHAAQAIAVTSDSSDCVSFETQIVEEKHINALKSSIVENEDELVELAMAFGWKHAEGQQFCTDYKEKKLRMKFFLLVEKWTAKLGEAATIGKLISALGDIEKGGKAKRILESQFQ